MPAHSTPSYEAYRDLFRSRPLPFAFVDLGLLARNAQDIARRAAGKFIRIASKSIRCVDILRGIFALHPTFKGIMAYTAAEAVLLSGRGFDDILVAYPTWQTAQIDGICGEVRAGKSIVLMLDSVQHVGRYHDAARNAGVVLPVCLDIDLSIDFPGLRFGVWRSPVNSVERAIEVTDAILSSPHLRLEGVMGYEAQIAGLGDAGSGLEPAAIRLLKRLSIPRLRKRRRSIVNALKASGCNLRIVNGGGTGSLETTAQEDCVNEVTAGSGFYSPALFDQYRDFRHLPAAGFAVEIVRRPAPGIFTCAGGGYIASGASGVNKLPSPYLPAGARLNTREAAGEVQTPVHYSGNIALSLGDPIFMRHAKAGELMEHFNSVYLIEGDRIVGSAPTYRGEGCSFL